LTEEFLDFGIKIPILVPGPESETGISFLPFPRSGPKPGAIQIEFCEVGTEGNLARSQILVPVRRSLTNTTLVTMKQFLFLLRLPITIIISQLETKSNAGPLTEQPIQVCHVFQHPWANKASLIMIDYKKI
jgi:hypothetical protein